MAQIQVRDQNGNALPRINVRISEGDLPSDQAIYDIFTDLAGNSGWPIPFWPKHKDYTLWVNDHNVDGRYGQASVHVAQDHDDNIAIQLEATNPNETPVPGPARTGVVRTEGRCVADDQGKCHFLGVTFFWAPIGMEHEPDRVKQNMDWVGSKGFDYARILGEVDWTDRTIDPSKPNYVSNMAATVEYLYGRGVRSQISIVGGRSADHNLCVDKIVEVIQPRPHMVLYVEMVNEWERLNKATMQQMQGMAKRMRPQIPNLIALSQPAGSTEEHGGGTWGLMRDATKAVDGNVIVEHTDRGSGDNKWRMVRQAYDFINTGVYTGSNQEGPGPQSSVNTLEHPLQLGLFRYLSHMAGAGFFTLHLGAGVSGQVVPQYGRPANLWEVPNIDEIVRVVKGVDQWLPEDVQNWKVVNNGRSNHPLPLDPRVGIGFWEGSKPGSVNKNYAALSPDESRFIEVLLGVKAKTTDGERVLIGTARRACEVEAIDPVNGPVETKRLAAGEEWHLPGRLDTMAGYIIVGKFV